MKETRPFIEWKLAEDFMIAVFEKYGVPIEDAKICADVLLESDRRGLKVMDATGLSRSILTGSKKVS